MSEILLRDDSQGICTLTLNRPQARNALSLDMLAVLQEQLEAIMTDRSVKVVILAATGPAFCAGHDLKEMRDNPSEDWTKSLFDACSKVMLSIMSLPQPVIARVHAMATAAGCQLVATCDLAVATQDAKFATPGVNIGLFCSTPMVALSRNVGRKKAMEMLLTGHPVSAEDAEKAGLLNAVVNSDKLDETVMKFAEVIASKSPTTLAIGKKAFYEQVEMGVTEAYDYASAVMTRNMMEADATEGICAFLDKRPPNWQD